MISTCLWCEWEQHAGTVSHLHLIDRWGGLRVAPARPGSDNRLVRRQRIRLVYLALHRLCLVPSLIFPFLADTMATTAAAESAHAPPPKVRASMQGPCALREVAEVRSR